MENSVTTTDVNIAWKEQDPKRRRVLEGATKVFLAYGFQRTTMDDIARAAEMSRPALYLVFRNKTDIYRAIAAEMLDETVAQTREGLRGDKPLGERLLSAVADTLIDMIGSIKAAPHGAEILDMKNSLAADIVASWRQRMAELVAATIREEAERTGLDAAGRGLSVEAMADMFLDGLEAMKMRAASEAEKREGARNLVRIVELALRP